MRYYIIFVILIILMVFFLINHLYKKTNAYQNLVRETKKFLSVPHNLEIVNTGSSHARYDITYNVTSKKGFNFALAPQALSYDYKILQQYKDNLSRNCIVIIVLPICIFFLDEYHHDQSNIKYYYFLAKDKINRYKRYKEYTKIKFPLLSMPWKVRYLMKDIPKENELKDGVDEQTSKMWAKDRIEGWNDEFNILHYEHQIISTTFYKVQNTLKQLIELCTQENWKPFIVIPPMSSALKEEVSKLSVDEMFYKNIRESVGSTVPVLDYYKDNRFDDSYNYFNSDFLTKQGREEFSKILFADIEHITK